MPPSEPSGNLGDDCHLRIYHRPAGGLPVPNYPPEKAFHITLAVNMCRRLLQLHRTRQAFRNIESAYIEACIKTSFSPWWIPDRLLNDNQTTDSFINEMVNFFPLVYVDNDMRDPFTRGFSPVLSWQSRFKGSEQSIHINGTLVDWMHDSRERGENENYRCFLHMFFIVLIGQLGQIFVTYLTKGDRANPTWVKTVGSLACNAPGSQGLVEIALEQEIFGDQIKFMIRPELEYREGQCATAYLYRLGKYREINRTQIDDSIRLDFSLPYIGFPDLGPYYLPKEWKRV